MNEVRSTGRSQSRSRRARLIRAALAGVAVLLMLLLIALLAGSAYELTLPSVSHAEARVAAILAAHHGTIDTLPVPSKLAAAVVSVEDEHFYSNVVVNVLDGVGRAALAMLHSSSDPGGSTIAQQLAKELYGKGSGLGATLEEIGLGVKLSASYSRAQVLSMYLNVGYYGNGYWGDIAAARATSGWTLVTSIGPRRPCSLVFCRRRRPTIHCFITGWPSSVSATSSTSWWSTATSRRRKPTSPTVHGCLSRVLLNCDLPLCSGQLPLIVPEPVAVSVQTDRGRPAPPARPRPCRRPTTPTAARTRWSCWAPGRRA